MNKKYLILLALFFFILTVGSVSAVPVPYGNVTFQKQYYLVNTTDWSIGSPNIYLFYSNISAQTDRGGVTTAFYTRLTPSSSRQTFIGGVRTYDYQYGGLNYGINTPSKSSWVYSYNNLLMSEVTTAGDLNVSGLTMIDLNGNGFVKELIFQNKNNNQRGFSIHIYGIPSFENGTVFNSSLMDANNTPAGDRILIGNATKWLAIGFNDIMSGWQINSSLYSTDPCWSTTCIKPINATPNNISYNVVNMRFVIASPNYTLAGFGKGAVVLIVAMGNTPSEANSTFDTFKNNWQTYIWGNLSTMITNTYANEPTISSGLNSATYPEYLNQYWNYALLNAKGFQRSDNRYYAGTSYSGWSRDDALANLGLVYAYPSYTMNNLKTIYNSTMNPKGTPYGETSTTNVINDDEFWWIISSVKTVRVTGDNTFMNYIYSNITEFLDSYITNPSYFNQTNYYLNSTITPFDPSQSSQYPQWSNLTNQYNVLNQILVYKALRESAWLARQTGNTTKANLYDSYADSLKNTFQNDFYNTTIDDLFFALNKTNYQPYNRYFVWGIAISMTDLINDTMKQRYAIRLTNYTNASDGRPLSAIPTTDPLWNSTLSSWYGGWWDVTDQFYTKLLKQTNGNTTDFMVNITKWLNGTGALSTYKNCQHFPEYSSSTSGFAPPQLWGTGSYINSMVEDVIGLEVYSNFDNALNFSMKPNTNQINISLLPLGNKLINITFNSTNVNIAVNSSLDWWNYTTKTLTRNTNNYDLPFLTTDYSYLSTLTFSSFNLTEGQLTKLYDTSNNLIDDQVPVQIKNVSSEKIYINSTQNYIDINIRINIPSLGDLTSLQWYYKAKNENPILIPPSNISYSGGMIFDLKGINISESLDSNEIYSSGLSMEEQDWLKYIYDAVSGISGWLKTQIDLIITSMIEINTTTYQTKTKVDDIYEYLITNEGCEVNYALIQEMCWNYSTRTLTDYNQSKMWDYLTDINTTIINLNVTIYSQINLTAQDVWEYGTRKLTDQKLLCVKLSGGDLLCTLL